MLPSMHLNAVMAMRTRVLRASGRVSIQPAPLAPAQRRRTQVRNMAENVAIAFLGAAVKTGFDYYLGLNTKTEDLTRAKESEAAQHALAANDLRNDMQLQESESVLAAKELRKSVQQLASTMKECIERLDSQVQLLAQINAAEAEAEAARATQ